jgi:hypothetical protein
MLAIGALRRANAMRGRRQFDCEVRMRTGVRARGPPASRRWARSGPAIRHRGGNHDQDDRHLDLSAGDRDGAEATKDRNRVVMDFATMYGVDEAFVGANPIRDLVGDELPWEIVGGVHGRLTNRGHLRIRVPGLVFTHDPEVPPEKQGTNDEDQFRAVVSCLVEQRGQVVTQNLTTAGFPATPSGNSDIDAQLALPDECVAPIIFIVAGSEDKWFAVTGFSSG